MEAKVTSITVQDREGIELRDIITLIEEKFKAEIDITDESERLDKVLKDVNQETGIYIKEIKVKII